MNSISRVLFSSLLGLPCFLNAQTFHRLGEAYGLPQRSIQAIAQDNTGFIWMGGRYGLSRYDGEHFRVYTHKIGDTTTLSDNYVTALLCDAHHVLWVGTNRGLNRYHPEKDVFKRGDDHAFADGHIYSLYEDRQGTIWVGTGHQLFYSDKRRHFVPVTALPGDSSTITGVHTMYEDSRAVLWAGCTTGLVRLEAAPGGYHSTLYPCPAGLVTAIWENPKYPGTLWVGTATEGVLSFDIYTGLFHPVASAGRGLPSNNVRAFCQNRLGRLWIGTQEGLTVYEPISATFTTYQHEPGDNNSLSQNSIYCLKEAGDAMWIGTYFGGVNIVYRHVTEFSVYQSDKFHSSISNDVVSCFAEDDKHNLWIGTEGGGLDYFDRSNGKFTVYKHTETDPGSLGSNLVKRVIVDREGNVWVGTHGGGLNVRDGGRFRGIQPKVLTTEVESLLEDTRGRFWVGSEDGLRLFTRKGRDLLPYEGVLAPLKVASVHVVYEDSRGNIWMASAQGIFVLKNGQSAFYHFPSLPDSLSSFPVNTIREDHNGRIWIGSSGGGLAVYDPATDHTRVYGEKDGLPDNTVMSIEEDNTGRLWLGTDVGLSCLDPGKDVFRNYTASDGLPTEGFNYNAVYKDNGDELFFGGFNGFISFVPGHIGFNPTVTPPVFTSLDLYNKPVAIGGSDEVLEKAFEYEDHIRFQYDQNAFTVHFALLNFTKPEKNRYAYKMTGVDPDWIEVSTPSATYTGLPAGDYIFMVKGANNDGVWSKPSTLHISILPPFWKTWWAYTLYLLALSALLFLVIRFLFLRELLKKEDALHQAKLNFFTNISHEIRTHLALISGPVEKMLLRHRDDEDRRQLQYVKKNSESLLQLVGELMDFRKAESGHLTLRPAQRNIVSFIKEIFVTFDHTATSRNIRTQFVTAADAITLKFDAEQLEKVFFNLFSNAFKFTPDGGNIEVHIQEKRSAVEVRVVDNGKGIAPENLQKLFTNYYQENDYGARNTGYGIGLALSKSIVELHKGQLKVESEPGVSTVFTVTLPKGSLPIPPPLAEPGLRPLEETDFTPSISGAPDGKKHSVLIVEDNPELRSFLRSALEDLYRIIEAIDGTQGWEAATSDIPDLIISDVMMPGMDGFTLCGKLKTDPRTSHIPVILLTAKSATADQISGLEMGADLYLAKPFSIHILQLHLRNLFEAREKMRRRYNREVTVQPRAVEEVQTLDDQFMEKAHRFVEERMDDPEFGVPMLSSHMLMSQPILYKKIKALTDMSVNDFIKNIRLRKAASLLLEKRHTVTEVIYMVGYSDRKHFAQEFKKMFDVTPSEYARDRP